MLLNFSAVHEPIPLPVLKEEAPYPNTPPSDSPATVSRAPAPPSLAPSSPTGLPTPSAPSPEASTSTTTTTKPKRKRKASTTNAVAGPSRHSSTDPGAAPAHWMGEDNARIRCICGIEDDDGFTVQCEGCFAWQHAKCFGYPNGQNLPEVYYCEKCEPRPFDAEAARDLQIRTRQRVVPAGEPAEPKKPRPKTKRPRVESGTSKPPEAAGEATDDSRDPGGMAPPAKPKRKPNLSSKPRSKTYDSALPGRDGDEDDYFRAQPWELEYTPLKDNIVRGVLARHAVAALQCEWVDAEEEPRRSKPSYHDSGLPSPTETGVLRLSPDAALSPPDFSILAAPIPPVFLNGPNLESLAAQTYIRPVEDPISASCYLPLKYIEPSQNIYARPTIYGVFVTETLSTGAFLGEYRCEVLDTTTYRKDPINQYAALGIPKPYVHSVGPPVNLVLDARSYGNEMRFVRSGCHPNVVIRPIFFRATDALTSKLHFGIFAARELTKNEEIVLGWEWDDQHVVHTLRSVIDSTLTKSANKTPVIIAAETVELLTTKFDTILTNIFSTFQSCACTVNTDCAFAQMRRQVGGLAFHGVSGARARKRIDIGELIGAVRGWRKRELEAEDASVKAKRFRNSGEWEIWRAGPTNAEVSDLPRSSRPSSDRQPSPPQEDEPADEEAQKEEMEVDPKPEHEQAKPTVAAAEIEVGEPEENVLAPVAVIEKPPTEEPAPTDEAMEVDEVTEVKEDKDIKTPPPVGEVGTEASVPDDFLAEATKESKDESKEDMEMEEAPATPVETESAPLPAPSSALSSLPPDRLEALQSLHEEGEEEIDPGHASDATTVTIVRSDLSGVSDGEQSEPSKTTAKGAASRRRRVLSPVPAPRKDKNKLNAKPLITATSDRRNVKDSRRRSRKHIIESTDEDASDAEPPTPKPRRSPVKSKSTKRAKVTKPASSDSDDEDDAPPPLPRKPAGGERVERRKPKAVVKDSEDEAEKSPMAVKAAVVTQPARESSPALLSSLPVKAAVPDVHLSPEVKQLTPEPVKEETPVPKQPTPELEAKEPTLPLKEATAPPKEATPPPPPAKEPTPPPPKKVSLKDYLASHKIRKKEKSPEPNKDEEQPAAKEEPKEEKSADAEPTPPAPAAAPTQPTQPARLNFLEHLPSSRSAASTPLGTPFTPGGASAASESPRIGLGVSNAFVPRADAQRPDYFNSQPPSAGSGNGSAFAPRPSPNFVPRGLDDPPRDPLQPSPVSAYQPRQPDIEYPQLSPVAVRPPLPLQTPPSKFQPLPDIPPPLGVRDGPPHHGHRAPPTGPRHAPTGPRGGWGGSNSGPISGSNASGGPVSPVNSMRGGFGGGRPFAPRGNFDRGYGYRGRGGPPRGRGRM